MSTDNIINFPGTNAEWESIGPMDVHKKLANSAYYVLLAVDENDDISIITNLTHREDAKMLIATALEDMNGDIADTPAS